MKALSRFVATALFAATALPFFQAAAQPQSGLPHEPEAFFTELQKFFERTKREDTQKEFDEFKANTGTGKISDKQLGEVIAVCDQMMQKRMRTYPHFTKYLGALNRLAASGKAGEKFDSWHKIVADMVNRIDKGKFNEFDDFIAFSVDFFEGSWLDYTNGKAWKMDASDYAIQYQNQTPSIHFDNATFYGYTPKDTIVVYNTSGSYLPLKKIWKGTTGKVTWERVGLDPGTVYAEIDTYTVDVKRSEYSVENVDFYHKGFFQRPLKGKLTDKLTARTAGTFLFPEFDSYDLDIKMTNIAEQTEYTGGFGFHGAKIIGFGSPENKAKLNFFSKDGRLILTSRALRYAIRPSDEINAIGTTASLYFGQDSIYHPRININYNIGTQELHLVRDDKASAQIAFVSSYHKLEAKVDAIYWQINTPVVKFKMVSQLKTLPVVFESFNLYDEGKLNNYRRVTNIDPVDKLRELAEGTRGQYQIHVADFAKYLNSGYKPESIMNSVFQMVEDGFIYYDPDSDIITVRDKVMHYMEARKGNVDYDRIALVSEVNTATEENAQLDLDTKELIVAGVEKIAMSDSQRVYLYPYKGLTRVHKNRDMEMDGTIVAGNVDFTGKNFSFEYDPFLIDMDSVDRMQIYVADPEGKQEKVDGELSAVTTLIRDVTGTLYIDKENNKSGKESLPSYPRFESKGNSFLYYNSKKLYDGAYKKDSFHFKLSPFEFSDLDEIEPSQLTFPGTMITADIFPPFQQTTSLREDFSLGFTKDTDANGMPTYGKGKFTGTITMSNEGLVGGGKVDYLASTLDAPEFVFLPDSMFANADTFYMERKTIGNISYPSAYNGAVKVKWLPKGEGMKVWMTKRPFKMFEEQAELKGMVRLNDKGSGGKGTMNLAEAAIRADDFRFTSSTFESDSSDVEIRNKEFAKVAFNSYNVKSKVDMDQQLGEFLANGENIPIVLPYNMYKTTASEFYWIMDEKIVNIRMPENDPNSFFESTHPDQDGLKFPASGAVVNLTDNLVQVDGIPYIEVADAKVRPYNTQLEIGAEADIKELENALMVADTATEYHKISDLTIKIKGKNDFVGSGKYKYQGKGMRKQTIEFDLITAVLDTGEGDDEEKKKRKKEKEKEEHYYTSASTNIPEDQGFKLNNRIDFKGDVTLDSRKPFLVFDGWAKIALETDLIESQWFSFKDQIDPDNISIDVSVPVGERKDTLTFGIMYDMLNLEMYTAFLSKKRTPMDKEIILAGGELDYNPDTEVYRIAEKEKLSGEKEQGNMLTLKDTDGMVTATGLLSLGEWGMVDVKMAGAIENNVAANTFDFKDMVLGVDFAFDDNLLATAGDDVRYYNADAEEVDYTKDGFMNAAVEMVNEKEVGTLKRMIGQYAYMPEKVKGLDQTLILSDLQMKYDTITRSLRSTGPFGLSFIGSKYVNRMVNGYVEIGIKQRKGDFLNIYIVTEEDDEGNDIWYFFQYKKGIMEVISSDHEFNQALSNIPEKKRRTEDKKEGQVYMFVPGSMQKMNNFLFRMRQADDPNYKPEVEEALPDIYEQVQPEGVGNGGGFNEGSFNGGPLTPETETETEQAPAQPEPENIAPGPSENFDSDMFNGIDFDKRKKKKDKEKQEEKEGDGQPQEEGQDER